MPELGTVENLGIDTKGYERRRRLEGIAACPKCDAEIELWSESEEWMEDEDGKWKHVFYGPAEGICDNCSMLIVDMFDGCRVYDLKQPKEGHR